MMETIQLAPRTGSILVILFLLIAMNSTETTNDLLPFLESPEQSIEVEPGPGRADFTTSSSINSRPFSEDTYHLFLTNLTREAMLKHQNLQQALATKLNKPNVNNVSSNENNCYEEDFAKHEPVPIVVNIWSYTPDGKLQLDQQQEIMKRTGVSSTSDDQTNNQRYNSAENELIPNSNKNVNSESEPIISSATFSTTQDVLVSLLKTLIKIQKNTSENFHNVFSSTDNPVSEASIPNKTRSNHVYSVTPRELTIPNDEQQQQDPETIHLNFLKLQVSQFNPFQFKQRRLVDDFDDMYDGFANIQIGNLTFDSRPLSGRLMHNLLNLTTDSATSSLFVRKPTCIPVLKDSQEDAAQTQVSPVPSPTKFYTLGQQNAAPSIPLPTSAFVQQLTRPPPIFPKEDEDIFLQDWWGGFGNSKKELKKKKDKGKHKDKGHEEEHKPEQHGWGWEPPSYGWGWGWSPPPQQHGWGEEHKEEEHKKKDKKKKDKKKKDKKKKDKKKKDKKKKGKKKKKKKKHKGSEEHGHSGEHGGGHGHGQQHGGGHQQHGNQHGGWHNPAPPKQGWGGWGGYQKPATKVGGWFGGWGGGHNDGFYEMEFQPADLFHTLLTGFGFCALFLGPLVFVAGICWLISSLRSPSYYVHPSHGWHRRLGLLSHDDLPSRLSYRRKSNYY